MNEMMDKNMQFGITVVNSLCKCFITLTLTAGILKVLENGYVPTVSLDLTNKSGTISFDKSDKSELTQ